MIRVTEVLTLHEETVARWHVEPISNAYAGALHLVCEQHAYNFKLWHEEDIARSPDVTDARIAQVKRNIDGFNQQRNDCIEKVDDWISDRLIAEGCEPGKGAPINSETAGSIIDRLSILALRIFHLHEQLARTDVARDHHLSVENKLNVCLEQREDLGTALKLLLNDIRAGRKRHKTYRQFKMYNDPTLNPYLYAKQAKRAG